MSKENYLLIDNKKNIYRNGKQINIKGKYSNNHPIIRILSEDKFLLIDSGVNHIDSNNAWIFNANGLIENSFFLGDVRQVANTEQEIIATYSECCIDMNQSTMNENLCSNGLVIFDYNGKIKLKYRKEIAKENQYGILENFSILKENDESIYLLPLLFSGCWSLMRFSLKTYELKMIIDLKNIKDSLGSYVPTAMCKKNDDWYFYMWNSEQFEKADIDLSKLKGEIFIYSNEEFEKIEETIFSHKVRGILNKGFFILKTFDQKGEYSLFIEL